MENLGNMEVEPKPVTRETVMHVFETIRYSFDSGEIDEKAYEFAMRCLVVGDVEGNHWTIGTETGSWYRKENDKWVRDDPPDVLIMAVPVEDIESLEKKVHAIREQVTEDVVNIAETDAGDETVKLTCEKCGTSLDAEARFCLECGTKTNRPESGDSTPL